MRLKNIFRKTLPKNEVVWLIGIPYSEESFFSICDNIGNSDFIESLELQYNTTDTKILWDYYKQTATKISKTINCLRNRNVKIVELHSIDQLQAAYQYRTIILTAHRHRYLESLDFMGNTISIDDIVDSIPKDFNGTMDLSSCYSSTFQMKCKQKANNATYIAAETETSINLRMFIYKQTIKHLIYHQDGTYLKSLRIIIHRIVENAKKGNNKNDIFLGVKQKSAPFSKENASAFAPNEIKRGEDMMIQIYIYKNEKQQDLICEAKNTDKDAKERSRIFLNYGIKEGDNITVSLNIINLPKLTQTKSVIWQNEVSKLYFFVSVPQKYKKEKIFIDAILSINDAILGELAFAISVVETYSHERKMAQVLSRRFNKVFVSYSHLDESQVKFIAQAYKAIGVDYFFDRHYLKAGDIYPAIIKQYIDSADLFILCWSKNAAESDYIKLERKQALSHAYPQVDLEKASITIHPISIEPHADYPEDMNNIYNFEKI